MHKRKIIRITLPLLIAGVLLGSMAGSVSSQALEIPTGYKVESKVVDLGWTTYAHSNHTKYVYNITNKTFENTTEYDKFVKSVYHEFRLFNTWNFSLEAGAVLPINLTIAYPNSVEPGTNATLYFGVESLPAEIFFSLSGSHRLSIYHFFNVTVNMSGNVYYHIFEMNLTVSKTISKEWNLTLEKTPIGTIGESFTDARFDLGTFDIQLYINHTMGGMEGVSSKFLDLSASFNLSLTFDAKLIGRTFVLGKVNVSGDALDEPLSEVLRWDSEGVKELVIGVSENATEGSSINADVELKYVARPLKVIFSNLQLNAVVDKEKVVSGFSQYMDQEFSNNQRMGRRLKERLTFMLNRTIENFVNRAIIFPVMKGKTVVRKPSTLSLSTESNTLDSGLDDASIVALATSIEINVGKAFNWLRTGLAIVAVGFVVGLIALVYALRRRNNLH